MINIKITKEEYMKNANNHKTVEVVEREREREL